MLNHFVSPFQHFVFHQLDQLKWKQVDVKKISTFPVIINVAVYLCYLLDHEYHFLLQCHIKRYLQVKYTQERDV